MALFDENSIGFENDLSIPQEVRYLLRFFSRYQQLSPHSQDTGKRYYLMAVELARLPYSPEVEVALRKLLESRDAALRSFLN